MRFDFEDFSKMTAKAYNDIGADMLPYTLDEVLSVFRYYFERYEETMKRPHPKICAGQLEAIVRKMPFIERNNSYLAETIDVLPETYPALIDLHFKTHYRYCDYNINHFFSGRIREMRHYEYEKGEI